MHTHPHPLLAESTGSPNASLLIAIGVSDVWQTCALLFRLKHRMQGIGRRMWAPVYRTFGALVFRQTPTLEKVQDFCPEEVVFSAADCVGIEAGRIGRVGGAVDPQGGDVRVDILSVEAEVHGP